MATAAARRSPPWSRHRRVEYEPEDAVKVLPLCKHYAHPECIAEWLKRNKVGLCLQRGLPSPGQQAVRGVFM